VLFFSIDARDMSTKLGSYFVALGESDTQRAMETVAHSIDTSFIGNVEELERAVSKTILLRSFEDIFAGLFWFIAFGVYGISGYVLIKLINQNALKVNANYAALANFAGKLQTIFGWLPSRLVGFSFALVGRFSKSAGYCMGQFWSGPESVKRFVVESGLAALDLEPSDHCGIEENHAALDIINRVIIIWLVALFFVLIGIMI
jgi:adenosylcobinamide-phosphate synthase